MCEALAKIMEPEIRQATEQAKREGWKEGREAGMEKGMEEGMEKGMEKGITLAKKVIRMDAQGCDLSEIVERTGVTEEQVRAILA